MGQHSFSSALALNITDAEKFEVGKKLTGWGRNWLVIFFSRGKKMTSQFLPRGRNGPAWSFSGERLAGGKNWPLHRPPTFKILVTTLIRHRILCRWSTHIRSNEDNRTQTRCKIGRVNGRWTSIEISLRLFQWQDWCQSPTNRNPNLFTSSSSRIGEGPPILTPLWTIYMWGSVLFTALKI